MSHMGWSALCTGGCSHADHLRTSDTVTDKIAMPAYNTPKLEEQSDRYKGTASVVLAASDLGVYHLHRPSACCTPMYKQSLHIMWSSNSTNEWCSAETVQTEEVGSNEVRVPHYTDSKLCSGLPQT